MSYIFVSCLMNIFLLIVQYMHFSFLKIKFSKYSFQLFNIYMIILHKFFSELSYALAY